MKRPQVHDLWPFPFLHVRRDPADYLLHLDPTVPKPTDADDLLLTMTRMFKLNPADFGLRLAEARLLELADRHAFTPAELANLRLRVKNTSGTWLMMRDADRQPGYAAAVKWLAARK